MLDCDPHPGKPALHWKDIDQIIAQVVPRWSETQRLWRASSSAFIYTSDGCELIGTGGWRGYAIVDDAAAIPAVGAHIYQRLWELGLATSSSPKRAEPLDRASD